MPPTDLDMRKLAVETLLPFLGGGTNMSNTLLASTILVETITLEH